jgi:hypothetical protein
VNAEVRRGGGGIGKWWRCGRGGRTRHAPPGYRLGGGRRFLDVASLRGGGRLSRLSSWSAHRSTLDARCDEPPVLTELDLLGSYDGE